MDGRLHLVYVNKWDSCLQFLLSCIILLTTCSNIFFAVCSNSMRRYKVRLQGMFADVKSLYSDFGGRPDWFCYLVILIKQVTLCFCFEQSKIKSSWLPPGFAIWHIVQAFLQCTWCVHKVAALPIVAGVNECCSWKQNEVAFMHNQTLFLYIPKIWVNLEGIKIESYSHMLFLHDFGGFTVWFCLIFCLVGCLFQHNHIIF